MRTLLFCSLYLTSSLVLPAQNLNFLARQDYGSANNGDLVIGDFNEDGITDLVTDLSPAASAPSSVCAFYGKGDGSFQPGPCSSSPVNGQVFGTADLNGDGHLDIAFLASTGSIYIAFGTGTGTFQTFTSVASNSGLHPVLMDVNADGKPDLVIPSPAPATAIEVLLGKGGASFAAPVVYDVGNVANVIKVADLNHDGKLDLAVGTNLTGGIGTAIAALLGKGDGTFQPALFSQAPHSVQAITAGDFNQDGTVDLMVGYGAAASGINLLLGVGDGNFRSGVSFATGTALSLDSGDLNGDGKLDVVVAGGAHTVSTLIASGRGSFQPPVFYTVGNAPQIIHLADLRNTQKLDAVSANLGNSLSVLLNQGNGKLNDGIAIQVSAPSSPSRAGVLRDFNGDTIADLAVTTSFGVQILLGSGVAGSPYSLGASYAITGASAIATGDFDANGALDLAVEDSSNMIHVLLGNGNGTFRTGPIFDSGFPAQTMMAADINGDGKLDLVTDEAVLLLGNGDGTFQPYTRLLHLKSAGLAVADLNGDKFLDLVFPISQSGGGLILLAGKGDGTFQSPVFLPLGGPPKSVLAADLNGDSVVDLAVPAANGTLYLVFNGGGGSFTTQTVTEPFWSELDSVAAGSFTRDNLLDLAVTNTTNNSVTILNGNGQGSYAYRGELGVNANPSLVLGSFNLVTLNGDGTISALTNQK